MRLGYARGQLPTGINDALLKAVTAAPHLPIDNDGFAPGVGQNGLRPKYVEILNREHRYRAFTADIGRALAAAFAHLRDHVAALLNSPWRVLNCRAWTTPAGWTPFGPNAWHADGDLQDILKMMIYCTETGGEHGGFALKDGITLEGPPGQWLLFYNSRLQHRGIGPTKEGFERVAVEVTIAPAWGFDIRPKFIGLVGRYPDDPYV